MYESSKPNARSLIIDMSLWIQTPFYLVAGIIWIFPARKVFDWIARGKR